MFSAATGAKCNPNVEYECTYGLICLTSTYNSSCQPPPAVKVCQSNADCADRGTLCICALDGIRKCGPTVAAIPFTCMYAFQTTIACQIEQNCQELSDDPNSCMIKNCLYEINCLYLCLYGAVLPVVSPFSCQVYPSYPCIVPTTGIPHTLLTGSPLPTLPKPYGENGAFPVAISSWLAAIIAALLLLW